MRYGFEQLDRLERLRQRHARARVLPADLGREAGRRPDRRAGPRGRERNIAVSVADEIAALEQAAQAGRPCAGHAGRRARTCWTASARSTSRARRTWRACRSSPWRGSCWPAIGWATCRPRPACRPWSTTSDGPPRALKVDLDRIEAREVSLDLYRNARRRQSAGSFIGYGS